MNSVYNPPAEDVVKVLLDDEIFERITDDYDPPKDKLGPANLEGWEVIGGYEGEIASVFMVRDSQLHFYVLKEFRTMAREFLTAALEMHKKTVFCEIPTLYRETVNFARRSGFKQTGMKRNAYMKHGKLYDIVRLEWAV